jgi:DNA-binding protein H-NS
MLGFLPDQASRQSNSDESAMRKLDLEAMDFDELWLFHEELTKILAAKISAEKLELEKRLERLNRREPIGKATTSSAEPRIDRPPRRKYPKVLPKYCNPSVREETWSGRGKRPRWLVAALQSGHKIEDFLITDTKEVPSTKVRRSPQS